MSPQRRSAVVAGTFFVVAAVTAVVALALYQPLLGDPAYVLGAGADTRVLWGALLEVVLAACCIGTAVTLYPVVKRQDEGVALGYVCGRLLEAAVIVVGVVSVLAVVSLRRGTTAGGVPGGADDGARVAVAEALVALHDWTFLIGPGLVIGVNSLLLAHLVYRSRLVPRWIAVLGLVGGPVVLASSTAVLFGLYEQVSTVAGLAALPVTAWEMSLAVYLVAKGFRPSPVLVPGPVPPVARSAVTAAA
ncbi:DUF4386 domain-containing protein [Geodermatophilus sabuli]|uniref:DUF4386 domain-containing protein n=1 Tax=Geodermatophilus sabuli TaxID=1564158 RepID=A0A285EEW2_9ACTN|nr:DUF4386 domain-containing protein [Geodermatophilus sabuli]MBB3086198.1 hypothetical protein [Geodermatophilus sabuli]SNX97585.1 protein of unknown function [Geodermatophilus sabuli]